MTGVDLSDAEIGWSSFGDLDLSEVKGLETAKHIAPSTIGLDTLMRAAGRIPASFLHGAGVPDEVASILREHCSRQLPFYSCFISDSTRDQDFADRLHADLQGQGVRCWFAPHEVRGGRKLHEQIDEAIRIYDRLLLILSDASMNSEWVMTEIAHARQKELNEQRQVLFPISLAPFEAVRQWKCFDADAGKDSAREIREYFIPDFSNWKDHDLYQKAFERLVRDLKAEGMGPAKALLKSAEHSLDLRLSGVARRHLLRSPLPTVGQQRGAAQPPGQ